MAKVSFQSRCLFLTSSVLSLVVFAHFSAVLTTRMTVGGDGDNVRSFADAHEQKIGLLLERDSANEIAMREAKEGTPLNK